MKSGQGMNASWPESRVLFTVLRSPHIDKKSREQFEMEIKKNFLIIKTQKHELRKKNKTSYSKEVRHWSTL